MSRLLLHDSGDGGKLGWATDAIHSGVACGFVLSPFQTPPVEIRGRRHALRGVHEILGAGGEVYFDPATHGATAPGADKFEIYDDWQLWPANRCDLASTASIHDHVVRAVDAGRQVGARPIAPTVTLARPVGSDAECALTMASEARKVETGALLAIAGTEEFWSSEHELDDFVGELAAMKPTGFAITVVRSEANYPPPAPADEVEGICRSVKTLSLRGAQVLAMHSDLLGLPAIAAGAARVGSSWHKGGRVFSQSSYRDQRGGPAKPRPTFEGLLASLRRVEAEALAATDPVSSARLHPGPLPPPNDKAAHWRHHLRVLSTVVDKILEAGELRDRSGVLHVLYDSAAHGFSVVEAAIEARVTLEASAAQWVTPLLTGLRRWMADEGYA